MKVYCYGLDLSDAIQKVIKASSVNKNLPILEGIKITAKGSSLTLTATDLELTIIKTINADVKIEGEVIVPGKFFSEFIRTLSGEQIELECIDNSNLIIKYMDSETVVRCLNLEEFPPVAKVEEELSFTIFQKDLKDAINKTIFSAATNDARPILKGCLLDIKEKELLIIAIDGYRLAMCRKALADNNSEKEIIVPARSLFEISKVMADDDTPTTVVIGSNKIMIDLAHTKIVSQLIEGEFIRYKNLISNEFASYATVSKQQFTNGVDRASLISRLEKNNVVKLDVKENIITIASNSSIGNIKENVVSSLKGRDLIISFNARYLMECMNVISDDFIIMSFTSSTSPCVIRPVEGDEFLYLILPMRT